MIRESKKIGNYRFVSFLSSRLSYKLENTVNEMDSLYELKLLPPKATADWPIKIKITEKILFNCMSPLSLRRAETELNLTMLSELRILLFGGKELTFNDNSALNYCTVSDIIVVIMMSL